MIEAGIILWSLCGGPLPDWISWPLGAKYQIRWLSRERLLEGSRLPRVEQAGYLPHHPPELTLFLNQYAEYLRDRMWADRQDYRIAIRETELLIEFWYSVQKARSDYFGDIEKRRALQNIVEMLDRPLPLIDEWPPTYPYWQFKELIR